MSISIINTPLRLQSWPDSLISALDKDRNSMVDSFVDEAVRFYCITAGPGPHRGATVVIVHPAPALTHSTTSWPQGKLDAPLCAIVKTWHHDFLTVRYITQFHSMVIVS